MALQPLQKAHCHQAPLGICEAMGFSDFKGFGDANLGQDKTPLSELRA
jgi:hypothetical protein